MGLSLTAHAGAQDAAKSQQAQPTERARRIAPERYRFLKRLEPKVGGFPVYGTLETQRHPLFPVGRSDRVYLFLWNNGNDGITQVLCYQRKDGKDKLVYRVKLRTDDKQAQKAAPVRTLLDYLRTSGRSVGPRDASDFAQKDLATARDYAWYSYVPYTHTLLVCLMSDLVDGNIPDLDTGKLQLYELDQDLSTHAKLKENEFYQKYGLPMVKGELPAPPSAGASQNDASKMTMVAQERYRFLKRLGPKLNGFPLYESGEEYYSALFPFGRSDRLYLLFWGAYWPNDGRQHDTLFCYQRQNGADKLVYRIHLHNFTKPANKVTRIKSLLDLLNSGEYWPIVTAKDDSRDDKMTGRMSAFAKNDLATERNYVQYTWIPYTDTLRVWVPTGRETNHPSYDTANYDLGEDPLTKAKLKEDDIDKQGWHVITNGAQEFFKKYGLPVAKEEVSLYFPGETRWPPPPSMK